MPSKRPGPSVKDPEQYEALRNEGASKRKAARIANASAARGRSAVDRAGGRSRSYESWTRADLYHRAAELGVGGRSAMNKDQLVDALRNS